jgi:hypothetical protein
MVSPNDNPLSRPPQVMIFVTDPNIFEQKPAHPRVQWSAATETHCLMVVGAGGASTRMTLYLVSQVWQRKNEVGGIHTI